MTEYSSFDETKNIDQESSTNAYSAMERQRMSRRRLLSLVGTGGGAVAATTILAACSLPGGLGATTGSGGGNTPKSSTGPKGGNPPAPADEVLAQAADIPVNSSKTFPIEGQQNPGVIVHLPDDTFVAYDSTCTHAQCPVDYNPTDMLLECGCHGSQFDPAQDGAVVQGPATEPLKEIKITVSSSGAITKE